MNGKIQGKKEVKHVGLEKGNDDWEDESMDEDAGIDGNGTGAPTPVEERDAVEVQKPPEHILDEVV